MEVEMKKEVRIQTGIVTNLYYYRSLIIIALLLLSLSYYYRSLIYAPFPPSQENSSNWRDAKLVSSSSLFIEEIGAGFASWKDCGITASVWGGCLKSSHGCGG
jgi:hypothetical protein